MFIKLFSDLYIKNSYNGQNKKSVKDFGNLFEYIEFEVDSNIKLGINKDDALKLSVYSLPNESLVIK